MNTYWWFRPSRIALLIVMPVTVSAFLASDKFYHQFGAFNAITPGRFFLAWLSLLSFAGASWFGEVVDTNRPRNENRLLHENSFRVVLYLLVAIGTAATLLLLLPLFLNPDLMWRILNDDLGAAYLARDMADKIPGITSWENIFSFVVVMLIAKSELTGRPRTAPENLILAFVISLTAIKVVLYSERLALIEMLVPIGMLFCGQRRKSAVWALAPIMGIITLFLFFMVTEYLRSWAYYSGRSDSLFEFALDRMIGYYMTAINNGAFVYSEGHSYFFPIFTGGWIWRFPIPGLADHWAAMTGATTDLRILLSGLNVEYNNTSGVFAPLIDFGPVLGIFVWTSLGYLSGRLYRRFRERACLGLLLFPTWYVGILEMPRVFYWGDSRYIPPLILSLVFTWMLQVASGKTPRGIARRGTGPMGTYRDRKASGAVGPQQTGTIRSVIQ